MRAAIVCIALALAAPALAAPTAEQEARALFKEGNRLRDAKDYAGALDMYNAAYAKTPNPKILVNIGSVQALMGKNLDAAATYERFLREAPADDPLRKTVQEALATVDKSIGKLIVDTQPGARVSVGGRELGVAPLPGAFRLDAGEVTLRVEKDGFVAKEQKVKITAGKTALVAIELEAIKVDRPVVKPEVKPEKPIAKPEKPIAKPEKPIAKPEKPIAKPEKPVASARPAGEDDPEAAVVDGVEPSPSRDDGGLGFIVRGHIDPGQMGGRGLVGATYAFGSFELAGAALVGPTFGGYLGANYYFSSGGFRPYASIAGLVFAEEPGTVAGGRAAAGIALRLFARVSLTVELGAELYPSAPENYESFLFVPSVGVQARL